ncbi:general odorant-binding protein 56d-like [Phymastichus coffea]|uniref:general odorant-binding protein 56d-like n=1 Tax=Phymastichus coffea TaxID=108790 RepID=UPI00273B4351|nr:general odorant-binding protein 56d-like [Phymastichus coffea]
MNNCPRQLVTKRLAMNFLLLFSIFGAIVVKNVQTASGATTSAKETILEIKASVDNCAKEAGFTKEQLNTALTNYDKNADDKVKCFRGCLMKAYKVITDSEKIDENAAIKFYHGDKLDSLKVAVQKCIANARDGSNHCDIAHKLESCMCSVLSAC